MITQPGEPTSVTAPAVGSGWTRRQWIGATLASLLVTGCGKYGDFSFRRAIARRGELHVLIWENYLSPDVIEEFLARTGIEVVQHFFSSNDELPDLLRARAFPYDLVMPSAFMGQTLRELGLLKSFNRANLPRLDQVDPAFNSKFDPDNHYTVPYIWGATGIGYNALGVDGLPKSWADLFASNRRADGGEPTVSVLDDARFTIGNALIYAGISPNTAREADIERAGEVLVRLRNRISYFESERVAKRLATQEVQLAMARSGDVTRGMKGDPAEGIPRNLNLRIALPREGSILFKDCFALPRATEHQEEAEELVDFLLQPEVAAAVTNYSLFATTVPAARPLVHRLILNGPSYFIHPLGAQKNFSLEDSAVPDEVYQRVWREVKAGSSPVSPTIVVPEAPAANARADQSPVS